MAGMPPQLRPMVFQHPFISRENHKELAAVADNAYKKIVQPRQAQSEVVAKILSAEGAVKSASGTGKARHLVVEPHVIQIAAVSETGGAKKKTRGFPFNEEMGICGKHATFGANAKACSDPARCPMAKIVKPEKN
jgi:hypothetical protein